MSILENYYFNEVSRVIENNKSSEFALKLVISGENSSTKYLNITDEQAEKIRKIFAE